MCLKKGEIPTICILNVKKHHMGKISGNEGLFFKIHMAALAGGFPFFCKQTPCFSNFPVNSKLGRGTPCSVGFRLDREVQKMLLYCWCLLGSHRRDGNPQLSSVPCRELLETSPELSR